MRTGLESTEGADGADAATGTDTAAGADTAAGPELSIAWARGVAANPQAPTEALLRLLDPAAEPAWEVLCRERALPEEVVAAIVTGSQTRTKRLLARNPHVSPEQRGRLALDPDAMVRFDTANGPARGSWRVQPLPDDVIEVFFTARRRNFPPGLMTAEETEQQLVFSGQVPPGYELRLVTHADPEMRCRAAWRWELLTSEQQAALLSDPAPMVREAAEKGIADQDPVANEELLPDHWTHGRTNLMMNRPMAHAVAERELDDESGRRCLAYNRYTPADIVERLARDPDPYIRAKIATRYGLPAELRVHLEQDPDEDVRTVAAAFGAATTMAQHIMLLRNTDNATFWPPSVDFVAYDDPGDPDWYAQAAESDNVHLRRAAACHPRLPHVQMRRLASDPDWQVKLLLAHNHPDAPPELMLEVFIAEPKKRSSLLFYPSLPRTGLGHLLDHPDPQIRAFAAADPTLPEPPSALLADEDETVRRTAAAHPLLPADVLDRLLRDPCHAQGAAANPRLDADALHRLLDEAGIPRRG
ncbi:MAG: hypothetical protein HOW97_31710 [Catenulispora sp.]|nr:hypothetical protein [Catenulispora sp.]